LEAIFLILDQKKSKNKRKPSTSIFYKGKILGDILTPLISEEDWDVMK